MTPTRIVATSRFPRILSQAVFGLMLLAEDYFVRMLQFQLMVNQCLPCTAIQLLLCCAELKY